MAEEEIFIKKFREFIIKNYSKTRKGDLDTFFKNDMLSIYQPITEQPKIVVIDSKQTPNNAYLEKQIENLKQNFEELFASVESLKSILYEIDTTKEEAILYFKERLNIIKEVKKVYCKQDAEGLSFWIFFKTKNTSKTLKEIVNVEIDVDSKYPNIFFNFYVDPLNEESSKFERKQWSPLISRG
jgi:hypothetical protein